MLADALARMIFLFTLVIQDINGEGSFELLNSLTSGQLADTNTGFKIRLSLKAYLNGRFTPADW